MLGIIPLSGGGYGMYRDGFRSYDKARRAQHVETINISLLMSFANMSSKVKLAAVTNPVKGGKDIANLFGFLYNGANIGHDITPQVGEIRLLETTPVVTTNSMRDTIDKGLRFLKSVRLSNGKDSVYNEIIWE